MIDRRAIRNVRGTLCGAAAIAASWVAAGAQEDQWLERIESVQSDDGRAWIEYFALGQELAELPGREGIEIVKRGWPLMHDRMFKQQIIKAWANDLPAPFRTRYHPHALELFAFAIEQDLGEEGLGVERQEVVDTREWAAGSWAIGCLPKCAWRKLEDPAEAMAWLERHRGEPSEAIAIASMKRWIETVQTKPERAAEHVNMLPSIGYPLRRNPALIEAAREAGMEAALLAAFRDEAVTTEAIAFGYYMLAELRPEAYPPDGIEAFLAPFEDRQAKEAAAARERLLASLDVRSIEGDPRKRWIVHAPRGEAPPDGWGLLVVAPGGDGSVDFAPFVAGTIREAAGKYIVVQLIAPEIGDGDADAIVWPREGLRDDRVEFTMEPIVVAAIEGAMAEHRIAAERVWMMGWSSGGPLAYEMALRESPLRGAFVVMSVFKPELGSPVQGAAGRSFYVLHSPGDFIPMAHPERAVELLGAAGGRARLETYEGGHGWHGDVSGLIGEGLRWLEGGRR